MSGVAPGSGSGDSAQRGAAITIAGLTKTFWRGGEATEALAAIDLEVPAGAFVCLLGPSGCGKSTLLHIIAGFLKADRGEVLVDGRRVTGPGAERCMLFQSPTLFPWLTTRDNVLFGPRAQGKPRAAAEREADQLLELVGLGAFRRHYPHQLSGGMRHRAALARALINRPRILLMDEPFAALDAITRASMQEFLLELWERQRTTIIFVTHDVEEASLLGDRVCVMSPRPGRILSATEVRLPRPRGEATRDAPDFVVLRRQMRAELARACQ
ncbi:MAG TPA: ABC transporter ATP-binding protein [Stellaceae bacterium]|nr:ABC transporter ATP-binding protein [Stellaceae bacterium]